MRRSASRPVGGRRIPASPRPKAVAAEALEPRQLLAATPQLVRDINQTSNMLLPEHFAAVGSVGFFAGRATGADGAELFKTDGTRAGTTLVRDIVPGFAGSHPTLLTKVGTSVFFSAFSGASGDRELWKSDGTAAGTVRVKDIRPGTTSGNPENLTDVNGTLYFTAFDATAYRVWRSDGTDAGTTPVPDRPLPSGPPCAR